MAETASESTPSTADLESWAERPSTDQTFPVLSDANWSVCNRWEVDYGIPTYTLIGRDMTYRSMDEGWSHSAISSALAESPPSGN